MARPNLADGVMRLALSSAAAPDATLDELLEAGARRGFAALELVDGHGHGVSRELTPGALAAVADRAAAAGLPIVAFRTGDVAEPGLAGLAQFASALEAPVVACGDAVSDDGWAALAVRRFAAAGAELLIATPGRKVDLARIRRLTAHRAGARLGAAWEIDPDVVPASGAVAVIAVAGPLLRHIRLPGGGPESVGQTGQGIGTLMSVLALHGYDHALALTPTTPRFRYAWTAWLGRRGGWGCGAKDYERELATLTRPR